jgi:diguanylate cyclase (GGDEF)-like protein/PAS domain S-box-containing protein
VGTPEPDAAQPGGSPPGRARAGADAPPRGAGDAPAGSPDPTEPGGPDTLWQSEDLYRRLVELSPDAVFVIKDGYHVFANGRGLTLFGARDLAELRRQPALAYMAGPGAGLARDRLSLMVDSEKSLDYVEEQIRTVDGRVVDIEAAGMPIAYAGEAAALVVVRDITERRRAEEARRRAETQFRSAFADAPIGMAVLGADGTVRVANPALGQMLDTPAGHLVGTPLAAVTSPEDRGALRALLDEDVATPGATRELRLRTRTRSVWALAGASLAPNVRDERQVLVQLVDITARKEAEARLAHLAWHDPLTGLPHRGLLVDRLEGALSRARRSGLPVGVVFLDLDDFKQVNDSGGHAVGDGVLRETAARLRAAVRESDMVARLGGDEFVVVAEQGDPASYAALAAHLAETLARPVRIGQTLVPLSASVGLAVCAGSTDADTALAAADRAMYETKQQEDGTARVVTRVPGGEAQPSSRWASSGANAGRQTATYSAPSGSGVV